MSSDKCLSFIHHRWKCSGVPEGRNYSKPRTKSVDFNQVCQSPHSVARARLSGGIFISIPCPRTSSAVYRGSAPSGAGSGPDRGHRKRAGGSCTGRRALQSASGDEYYHGRHRKRSGGSCTGRRALQSASGDEYYHGRYRKRAGDHFSQSGTLQCLKPT